MRLIDLDEFAKLSQNHVADLSSLEEEIDINYVWDMGYLECLKVLDSCHVIRAIPIDKPFLKMRYGDYVVYNKEWLVNHLQTEWTILQGKEYQPSISVEWIWKWYDKETHRLGDGWTHVEHPYSIKRMIEDWEKENEDL